MSSIEMSGDVRGWFHEHLSSALERVAFAVSDTTKVYLLELLARFAESATAAPFEEPLALQLAQAQESAGIERLRRLRAMGDSALYSAGFFSDHLERRGVTRSYVAAMGGQAYWAAGSLSRLSPSEGAWEHVFHELAGRFDVFVDCLDEVRESTSLRTPQDIVKLYDRWLKTGDERLAERLRREGVHPSYVTDDRLH